VSLAGPGLWYATRAAGLVTLLLLTASTTLGVLTATRAASTRWPRFIVIGLHRNLALLGVVFLVLHVGTTVVDTYTSIGLQDAIVPFLSGYHRFWLGLGAIASDLFVTLIVTSLLRQRMRPRLWRTVHWCGYLSWPVALAHGLGIGTDRSRPWVFDLTMGCTAVVGAAILARLVQAAMLARGTVR
jgi:sulfoxide reductase heme-binding subunit YedZ